MSTLNGCTDSTVPLTWMSRNEPEKLDQLSKLLEGIIEDREGKKRPGIQHLDAETITNVLLYELVENVAEHARITNWAQSQLG